MAKLINTREAETLAILINGEKYGLQIRDEYERRTKTTLPLGSLYTMLERIEAKGFIKSRMGESSHERGGNRRKYFKITASGTRAVNEFRVWAQAFAMTKVPSA